MEYCDHEKLDVYQAAVDYVALADSIIEKLPRGRAYLADQIHRTATSITLNVAEGAGESVLIDVCRRLRLAEEVILAEGRELLLRIVSMLTKMVRKDEEGPGTGMGTRTEEE